MGYIHCCGGLRKTRSFVLAPYKNFILCELDILNQCPVCEHFCIQLTRLNSENQISTIRYTNKKAKEFLQKIKSKILYERKNYAYSLRNSGKFYLNYNEYGVKKRCYSNISTLKLGLH